jgi:hypothetical protein
MDVLSTIYGGYYFCPPALAWGTKGHRMTARIAAKYLNARARAEVITLLQTAIRNNAGYYQENCSTVLALSKKRMFTKREEEEFLTQ